MNTPWASAESKPDALDGSHDFRPGARWKNVVAARTDRSGTRSDGRGGSGGKVLPLAKKEFLAEQAVVLAPQVTYHTALTPL